jgi:uncharacterized membrane protein HdeD (DUF308 family)
MSNSAGIASFSVVRSLPAHNWSWFLVRGLLMLALGVIALFAPGLTLVAFAAVFAVFSLFDGILAVIIGIRGANNHAPHWLSLVFAGLFGIAVGLAFIAWPLFITAVYAALVLGLISGWAIVTGTLQLSAAVRLHREIEGEWLLGLIGLLTLVLGIALLVQLWREPLVTLVSVAWLIGIWAIVAGISLTVLALRLRSRAQRS